MLPNKTPPKKDASHGPASTQLTLHTSPAAAQVERREAHAKGLIAPHMLSRERYPPTLIDYVNNWNKAEFVNNDNLPEKFGPTEFAAQMNTAAKVIILAGRMMEVCYFVFSLAGTSS